jgi:hypothetical protein
MGPELEASVAFSPAGSISTSPLPSYETQPDSGVANPSQGTTEHLPPARPAAPSALAPLQVFPEVAKAGDDGHSLHLADGFKTEAPACRSSLESLARFSKAQITLTLGTQPDGALMEFMLGAQIRPRPIREARHPAQSVTAAKLPHCRSPMQMYSLCCTRWN